MSAAFVPVSCSLIYFNRPRGSIHFCPLLQYGIRHPIYRISAIDDNTKAHFEQVKVTHVIAQRKYLLHFLKLRLFSLNFDVQNSNEYTYICKCGNIHNTLLRSSWQPLWAVLLIFPFFVFPGLENKSNIFFSNFSFHLREVLETVRTICST